MVPLPDEMPPPPLPKSPPTKPKKVQLPSPPQIIRDNQRKMVFTRCGFLGEASALLFVFDGLPILILPVFLIIGWLRTRVRGH